MVFLVEQVILTKDLVCLIYMTTTDAGLDIKLMKSIVES